MGTLTLPLVQSKLLSTSLISARLKQRWCSTMMDIAWPRARTMTLVTLRAKSVAKRSYCINPSSELTRTTNCNAEVACRALGMKLTSRTWMRVGDDFSRCQCSAGINAPQFSAPPGETPCTPCLPHCRKAGPGRPPGRKAL